MTRDHPRDHLHSPSSNTERPGEYLWLTLPYRPLWRTARDVIGCADGVAWLDGNGSARAAEWSILGVNPRRIVAWPQGAPGAFAELGALLQTAGPRPPDAPVPFQGGWIGWFSYDLGRHIERLPAVAEPDPAVPDFVLGEYDVVLLENHAREELFVAGRLPATDGGERMLRRRAQEIFDIAAAGGDYRGDRAAAGGGGGKDDGNPRRSMTKAVYLQHVETILAHIRAGDIYQANLSHRFELHTSEPSRRIYERLRAESPAPFGCYFDFQEGPEILSISPELFLRKRGNRVETRPIKGTRPRHADPDADAQLLEELASSPKERAELLMITDLLRNDLGKVARYGSVRVEELRALESHATVHHASSTISATLRNDATIADLLAATLPGGSVTGAPKIRAMEILEHLEPVRRGPYTGAAGFIGYDGDLCLSILIRTLSRSGDCIRYQVGGGIVADSDPQAEYDETLAKGAAMMRALSSR